MNFRDNLFVAYLDPCIFPSGRSYADGFLSLPDRKAWAEYYKVITHPMSLDVVAVRSPYFICTC